MTAPVHAPAEPISSRGAARWVPASASTTGPRAGAGRRTPWPQSLRSAVSILLPSRAQVVLFWGPEFIAIYNDAYAPVFGAKLPSFSRRRSRP